MDTDDNNVKCYRLPLHHLRIGVFCLPFFALAGVASTITAYRNVDGSFTHPVRDAIVFGGFWSAFAALSGALIGLYFRYHLFLSDREVKQIGLLRTQTIDLSTVSEIRWRTVWRDVVLRAGRARLRIELEQLADFDRHEVIAFFRDRFTPAIQSGWPAFSKLPLVQTGPPAEPWSWRRFSLLLFLGCLATSSWFFLFVWLVADGAQNLVVGLVSAMLLLLGLSLPATWRELRRTQDRPSPAA